MDGTRYTVTLNEFKLFHGIDRALYRILVWDLYRNPIESLYILGLWLWLERGGFYNFISKILPLPPFIINELADEAVTCLKCLNLHFPFSSEASEIPLTHSLAKKDISMQFFYERHLIAFHEIQDLVKGVCIPSVSELMDTGCRGLGESPIRNQMVGSVYAAPSSYVNQMEVPNSFIRSISPGGRERVGCENSQNERTMFVTFSKGYPVSEVEVRQFFLSLFGNCIESFHMQEVGPDEQALYAKIVFLRPAFIWNILNGVSKAKFTINGKHIWMRKFVAKNDRPMTCGCSSMGGACTCLPC